MEGCIDCLVIFLRLCRGHRSCQVRIDGESDLAGRVLLLIMGLMTEVVDPGIINVLEILLLF